MNEIIGLPADVSTAITVIVTGVIVPALTSVLKYPGLSKTWKRIIPIALAAFAGIVIVWLQAGGPFVEQVFTWLVIASTVVGIAQAVYSAMPGAWKKLEDATSGASRGQDGPNTAGGHRGPPRPLGGAQSGLERSVDDDVTPYRERTLNQPEGEDYTRG